MAKCPEEREPYFNTTGVVATEALLKEVFGAPSAERWVYVVCIDIKDGWFDIIAAFDNRAAATEYIAWQQEHTGDAAYMSEVPLDSAWTAPPGRPQPTRAIKLVPLEEA